MRHHRSDSPPRPRPLSPGSSLVRWASALAAVVLLGLPGAGTASQPPEATTPSAKAPPAGAVGELAGGGEPGYYLGVASCTGSGCHSFRRPQRATRVLQNEYFTWLQADPHQRAFGVLSDETSALIARNMKLAEPPAKSAACLGCHAVNAAPDRVRGRLTPDEGISCERCHGPASGWRDGHTDPSWSRQDSLARGLRDLRDPAVQTQLCLSCHLGTGTASVDHELIAAGHPPLIFELTNYAANQPPHWDPGPRDGVRAWAVGQAVTFERGLRQVARRAGGSEWPEFSDMSCYACHHDLSNSAWRQRRGFRDRPGRPPWSPARWAVLRHLVDHVAPAQRPQLDREVDQLARAVARMNRPTEAAAAATSAAETMAPIIKAMSAQSWDDAEARRLIATLAGDRDYLERADVSSAEQVLFAVQTLVAELARRDPGLLRPAIQGPLRSAYAELQDPERFNRDRNRFFNALSRLGKEVQ